MAAAKRSQPPSPQPKQFTLEEVDLGIRKLRRRLDEVRALDASKMGHDNPQVDVVESNIREAILDIFGATSPEYNEHKYHSLWRGAHVMGRDPQAQAKFAAGIEQSIAVLDGLVARLEEKRADLAPAPAVVAQAVSGMRASRRVFIVHGHDQAAREATARFAQQLELEPVILSEQANQGRTIIEKFEHLADVAYAIVLLTPDDIGSAEKDSESQKPRARQNVVLELGYFIGRLGRANVCALYKGAVELPSDLHGVLYVMMDDGDGWKLKLAKEMKSAGLDIDMNRAV